MDLPNKLLTHRLDLLQIGEIDMKPLKSTISVVILAKERSSGLIRAIESVLDQVDEIVVIDTSKNLSSMKFEEKKVKVYKFIWNDDFSSARNFGIKKSSCTICFMLDSDEYLSIDLQSFFRVHVLELFSKDNDALYSPFIDNLNGYFLLNNPRIFRIRESLYYKGFVHEYLFEENSRSVHVPSIVIKHTGYIDKGCFIDKNLRNYDLLSKQVLCEPGNARWKFFLLRYLKPSDLQRNEIMKFFYSLAIPYSTKYEVYALNVVCRYMIEMLDSSLYENVEKKSSELLVYYPCREIAQIHFAGLFFLNKHSAYGVFMLNEYLHRIKTFPAEDCIVEKISARDFKSITDETVFLNKNNYPML